MGGGARGGSNARDVAGPSAFARQVDRSRPTMRRCSADEDAGGGRDAALRFPLRISPTGALRRLYLPTVLGTEACAPVPCLVRPWLRHPATGNPSRERSARAPRTPTVRHRGWSHSPRRSRGGSGTRWGCQKEGDGMGALAIPN